MRLLGGGLMMVAVALAAQELTPRQLFYQSETAAKPGPAPAPPSPPRATPKKAAAKGVKSEPKREPPPERASAEALAARLRARALDDATDTERARLDELLGCLVEFHRREERPMWWALFERHDRKTVEERFDDPDCLAAVVRTSTPALPIKRSRLLEYSFNPEQETKLHAGDSVQIARF